MRARRWWVLAALAVSSVAGADPTPKPVDIKPIRDRLIVLQDADGGTYAVLPGKNGRMFYGLPHKPLYEQVVVGRSANGDAWDLAVWAPRVADFKPGSISRQADGSFVRHCGDKPKVPLTEVSHDKAAAILTKAKFMTSATIRRPHLLARDDTGVYYYVDVIRQDYGGNGYRVLVGRKGALKQKPLVDIASDSAGDVFATKSGNLRLVRNAEDGSRSAVTWIKGNKRATLTWLDPLTNERLIYTDLGVYGFIGSICENQ